MSAERRSSNCSESALTRYGTPRFDDPGAASPTIANRVAAHDVGVGRLSATMDIQLFDTVRLLRDRPELGLRRGDTGVVVDVHVKPELGYEVEFMDEQGRERGPWLAGFAADELQRIDVSR